MLTKIAASVLLAAGVLTVGSSDDNVTKPICCIKNAYCCQVQRDCCPKRTSDATAGYLDTAPKCCAEQAACCLSGDDCCPVAAHAAGYVASQDRSKLGVPACCDIQADCCRDGVDCCPLGASESTTG